MIEPIFDHDRLDVYRLMLTRLIARSNGVAESGAEYAAGAEYEYRDAEYEYRDAEYEYEEEKPEPSCAPKDGLRGFTNGKSIARPR